VFKIIKFIPFAISKLNDNKEYELLHVTKDSLTLKLTEAFNKFHEKSNYAVKYPYKAKKTILEILKKFTLIEKGEYNFLKLSDEVEIDLDMETGRDIFAYLASFFSSIYYEFNNFKDLPSSIKENLTKAIPVMVVISENPNKLNEFYENFLDNLIIYKITYNAFYLDNFYYFNCIIA
jgi:hypothetical protein